MADYPRPLTGGKGVVRWQGKSGASFATREEADADSGARFDEAPFELSNADTQAVLDYLKSREGRSCQACIGSAIGIVDMTGPKKLKMILDVLVAAGRVGREAGCTECLSLQQGYSLNFTFPELIRRTFR